MERATEKVSEGLEDVPAIGSLRYRLCPHCLRAVPSTSGERYCINDGTQLLDACSHCGASVTSPFSRFCGSCGASFGEAPQKR